MHVYRGMDQAALDAAYNNTAAVADSARDPRRLGTPQRGGRRAASAAPRSALRAARAQSHRLTFRPRANGAPVLVFIHGGYWQMRAKETFRFLAAGPLAHGINVALTSATRSRPKRRCSEIVAEVHERDHVDRGETCATSAATEPHLRRRAGPRAGISPRCRSRIRRCAAGSRSAASSISSRYA